MSDPSQPIALAICQALHINSDNITAITLELRLGELPHITIEQHGWDPDGSLVDSLQTIITNYELQETTP